MWIAVGIGVDRLRDVGDDTVKAFGPFASADEAREFCNMLAVPVSWAVVPLRATDPTPL